ncbi:MAG: 30S ribosomal protein S1 [Planctomycetes bacterium]|nr:30S ribosomal protein S1 [Planctomycetota bacterium]MCB9910982.1 30S ribosomal protein S1 [Planctomycetota bacterium]
MSFYSSERPGDPTPRPVPEPSEPARGNHTLRVHEGTIVGVHGDDVFVDLGPRLQGVVSARAFDDPPRLGDVHRFTMRGREESLWVLSLVGERSSESWLGMQEGQWVSARVVREHQGHLQLKVDGLHAVMPHTHTGKSPGQSLKGLVGKNLVCEVLEVDTERQRVVLSRKRVLQRQKEDRARKLQLLPGDLTQGRVTRIESYGAFLRLPGGREGLLHISDIAHQRLDHPSERLQLGETLEVKVLRLSHGGKRIALGLKQLLGNPWRSFARLHPVGSLVVGTVYSLEDAGLRVELEPGIGGWIPRTETPFGERRLGVFVRTGQTLPLRVIEVFEDDQDPVLSMLDSGGRALRMDEVEALEHWRSAGDRPTSMGSPAATGLGSMAQQLREALERRKA